MTGSRYPLLVRLVAVMDLGTSLLFALPWTFSMVMGILGSIAPLPDFAPIHLLFVYLLGTLCVTWALIRIAKPEPWLGLTDGLARLAFGAWQVWFLLGPGINPGVWIFAGLELVPALFMVPLYFRWKKWQCKAESPSAGPENKPTKDRIPRG